MMRRGLCACVMLACVTLTACNQDRALAVRQMNSGLAENQAGMSSEAVQLLKEATEQDKTYADPPYYLAQIYHQKFAQLDEAVRYYQVAVERAPDNAQMRYRLGSVLAEQGKHSEALEHFERATTTHDQFAKAWFRMGLSQLGAKAYPEAVASLTRAIKAEPTMKIGPEDPGGAAYHALGDLYLRFGFYDKALKVYEDGARHNPEVARMHHGKGVAQLKLKRAADAVNSFKQAIEREPANMTAYFNLSIAQRDAGQVQDALASVERYLDRADPAREGGRMGAALGMKQSLQAQLQK